MGVQSWVSKLEAKHNLSLINSKGNLSGLCPLKTTLLHALSQEIHNGAKILDELQVERGQPMKATDLRDSS